MAHPPVTNGRCRGLTHNPSSWQVSTHPAGSAPPAAGGLPWPLHCLPGPRLQLVPGPLQSWALDCWEHWAPAGSSCQQPCHLGKTHADTVHESWALNCWERWGPACSKMVSRIVNRAMHVEALSMQKASSTSQKVPNPAPRQCLLQAWHLHWQRQHLVLGL